MEYWYKSMLLIDAHFYASKRTLLIKINQVNVLHVAFQMSISLQNSWKTVFLVILMWKISLRQLEGHISCIYRILPIKGASPNKGARYGLKGAVLIRNHQNWCSSLNNCPIFNPKPPLESSQRLLFPDINRYELANAPGALIRQNTVYLFWYWLSRPGY